MLLTSSAEARTLIRATRDALALTGRAATDPVDAIGVAMNAAILQLGVGLVEIKCGA